MAGSKKPPRLPQNKPAILIIAIRPGVKTRFFLFFVPVNGLFPLAFSAVLQKISNKNTSHGNYSLDYQFYSRILAT
jgi:hypothetical protein